MDKLCPSCRERAVSPHCLACGTVLSSQSIANPSFDMERFQQLKGL